MANLEGLINEKAESDKSWKEQREKDREYVVTTRDGGIMNVTSNPTLYGEYLTLQGNNPSYSAGNIVLCLHQLVNPSIIGTPEKWRNVGRYVKADEKDNGAKIFVRPNNGNGKGYTVGFAYDISQTDGKEYVPQKLEDESPQMEKALAGLLRYSPVKLTVDRSMESPAFYDESKFELFVNPDVPDSQAFDAIATEIALARMHDKGYNTYYNRGESYLAADSISYLLCRRYGIGRELPDASNIAALYGDMSAETRTNALNAMQDMAKLIGGGIEKQITAVQRSMNIPQRNRQPARAGR